MKKLFIVLTLLVVFPLAVHAANVSIGNLGADGSPTSTDVVAIEQSDASATNKATLANIITKGHGLGNGSVKIAAGAMAIATDGTDYLSTLVADTTPQLGGFLDLNNKLVVDAANAFGAADTTPNVTGGTVFKTGAADVYTDFQDADDHSDLKDGQLLIILFQHAAGLDFTSSELNGNGGQDWTATDGDYAMCVFDDTTDADGQWLCHVSSSDLPALSATYIFVGNAGGIATAVDMTGDISISNAGVTAIEADTVGADEMVDADHGMVSWTSGAATVEDFALNADGDAGDVDILSVDKLEGVDNAVFVDLGANGVAEIQADTQIQLDSPIVYQYDTTTDDPAYRIGATDTEEVILQAETTADALVYFLIETQTAGGGADAGKITIKIDEVEIGQFDDAGLELGVKSTLDGAISLHSDAGHTTSFQPHGTTTADAAYVLPAADGTANQYLKTDGSKQLLWDDPTGAGTVTHVGADDGGGQTFTESSAAPTGGDALFFEGTSSNTSEIKLTSDNPGADFIITLPDQTGHVILGESDGYADNTILTANGTGTHLTQETTATIDDSNNIAGVAKITITDDLSLGAAPASTGAATGDLLMSNATGIYFEADAAGTDVAAIVVNSSEAVLIGSSGATGGVTITPNTVVTGTLTVNGALVSTAGTDPIYQFNETDGTDWEIRVDDTGNSLEIGSSSSGVGDNVEIEIDEDGDIHITGDAYVAGAMAAIAGSDPTVRFDETDGTDWEIRVDDSGNTLEIGSSAGGIGDNVELEIDEDGDLHLTGNLYASDTTFLTTNTDGYMIVADGTDFSPVAVSNDVALTNAGDMTVTSFAVTGNATIADDITVTLGTTDPWTIEADTTSSALEFVTAELGGTAATDPMFLIQADSGASGMVENQVVLGVYRDTTKLFTVDEDGDLYYAGAISANASDDPYLLLNTATASDTDWWMGTDADQEGDDDDRLEWRTNTTPGSNVLMWLEPASDGAPGLHLAADLWVAGDDVTLTTNTSGAILVADGTNYSPFVVSGDAAISAAGVATVVDFTISGEAQGEVLYYDGSNWASLNVGTSGQFLKTQGAAANPVWASVTATAAGANTQVQYNSTGSLGAEAAFTYTAGTNLLLAGDILVVGTTNPADAGTIRLENAASIVFEDAVEFTMKHVDNVGVQFVSTATDFAAGAGMLTVYDDGTGQDSASYLIRGAREANGDPQDHFLLFEDASDGTPASGDEMFSVSSGGVVYILGTLEVDGTASFDANPAIYDGSDYLTLDADGLTSPATITFGGDTNNLLIANGTATVDIAAGADLDLDTDLTIDGQAITISGVTGARTITLNENLTVGGGTDITVTAEDAAQVLTLDNVSLEVEDTQGSGKTIKIINAVTDASKDLTIEASSLLNQDLTTDFSPTFVGLTLTGAIATPTTIATSGIVTVGTDLTITGLDITADGTEEVISLVDVASAVNELSVSNSATGTGLDNQISLIPTGGDGVIGMLLDTKAGGTLTLGTADSLLAVASTTVNIVAGAVSGVTTLAATGVVSLTDATEASAAATAAVKLTGGLGIAKNIWSAGNITLDSDGTIISFGDTQEIVLTHTADVGLNLSHVAEMDDDEAQFTIENTDADLTDGDLAANAFLLRLRYTDDGDADGAFIVAEDNNGDDKFIVDMDGAVTIAGAAEGTDALTLALGDITLTDGDLNLTAGDATFGEDVTITGDILAITGNDLMIGTVDTGGVKLTSDGDGMLTILGSGAGNDESLTLNLDDGTANTAYVGTGSGVVTIDFASIALSARFDVTDDGTDNTISKEEMNGYIVDDDGDTWTIANIQAADGLGWSFCFYNTGSSAITIEVDADDRIRDTFNDGALEDAGDGIVSAGAAGEIICMAVTDFATDVAHWSIVSENGTWTPEDD